ncbi:hypothetical protein K5549_020750, partial [Capra hircus]
FVGCRTFGLQDIREKIRKVVQCLEQTCAGFQDIPKRHLKTREHFGTVKTHLTSLRKRQWQPTPFPAEQYYRFHEHRRFVLVCCVLGVETIVNREVVTKVLGSERDPKKGFHSDVEDSLSEFSFSLTTPGPCTSPPSSNELDSGFCLLNLKNDSLRKRYEGLKYDVKKVKKVVCHLSIRGCNREPAAACVKRGAPRRPC